MEDNIQTIIVVIISAFLLFIFPVYMAYEKKDDISYALAMRYTQDLVDEVRSKGYITKYMYEDYRAKLKVTGNSYDIQLTHEYNRYDPITNYYKVEGDKYILVKTSTQGEREEFEKNALREGINLGKVLENYGDEDKERYLKDVYEDIGINKVEDTYKLSKETYTTDHILSILNSERKLSLNSNSENVKCSDVDEAEDGCQYAYIMNVDDNFNVTIKNTNITFATVIYNMVTANTLDDNTRIYVNYGGAILSSKWYGDVDYSKMKHDNLDLRFATFEEVLIFADKKEFPVNRLEDNPIYSEELEDKYILDFDVLPEDTTELRQKGSLNLKNYTGYNFAVGNGTVNNEDNMMSVSVGMNGVSIITNMIQKLSTSATYMLDQYKKAERVLATSTTCKVKNRYVSEDENGEEVVTEVYEDTNCSDITKDTQITDYKKIQIQYISSNKFGINLTGKAGIKDVKVEVTADTGTMLQDLNYTKNNPSGTISASGNLSGVTNMMDTQSKYYINITNNSISVKIQEEERTKITDYNNVRVRYVGGKIRIDLEGKSGINNYTTNPLIQLKDEYLLLKGLDKTITNPTNGTVIEEQIGSTTTVNDRSTTITYKIIVNDSSITVRADQSISEETTILSCPITIDEYVNVRIEFDEIENIVDDTKKYVAVLYVDNERVDESIEMISIPKVNIFGTTFIGDEQRKFTGKIANAKIYRKVIEQSE